MHKPIPIQSLTPKIKALNTFPPLVSQDRATIERNFKQQVAYLKNVPSTNFEYAMKIRVSV